MAIEDKGSPADGHVADSLAQTARDYDDVTYTALPFPRLQPARIRGVARLLGLERPAGARSRTLEIGCATGGHIIPIAARSPEATFVGVDISPNQIALGMERIRRLGLTNIELQARSLTELGPSDGLFDTIICHGVYSWVPQPVRDVLMKVIAERLAPDGLAVVSFNVLPGWRMYQVVRDSMILHAGAPMPHAQRMALTRQLYEAMKTTATANSTYQQIWLQEAKRMFDLPDFYLAHEIFESNNVPCSFGDFIASGAEHGLAYLAETRLGGNIPENSSSERARLIRNLAGNDLLQIEKYIDIVTGRTFRESILIHEDYAAKARRVLDDASLDDLHFDVPAGMTLRQAEDGSAVISLQETDVDVRGEAVVRALGQMIERRPATSDLATLAPPQAVSAEDRENLRAILMKFVCVGLIDVTTEPVLCAAAPGERPCVWRVAAADALNGDDHTATMNHRLHRLEPFARFLLPLIDGTRTREDLLEAVYAQALKTDITDASGPVKDPVRLREISVMMLDQELHNLARAGLLVG